MISPTSVVALKGRRLTVRQVADTLHVRHVLDGSFRAGRGADRGQRTAHRHAPRPVIWKQTYRLGGALQLQDAIARHVTGALLTAGGDRPLPAAPRRTVQVAAYESYLKGVYWLQRRTPEGLRLAIAAFEEALALDADYPQALAGLASAHTYSVIYGYRGEADPYNELAEALRLASRAVARDSSAAEGWLARRTPVHRVRARGSVGRTWTAAPTHAQLCRRRADLRVVAVPRRKPDAALAEARRGLALDPLAGDQALDGGARDRCPAVRPGAPGGAARLPGGGSTGLGDPAGVRALLSGRAAECAPATRPWVAVRAMCLHRMGRGAEAATLADSLGRELDGERYASSISTPISPPTTRGGAMPASRSTGSARWLTRRCCTSGGSNRASSTGY